MPSCAVNVVKLDHCSLTFDYEVLPKKKGTLKSAHQDLSWCVARNCRNLVSGSKTALVKCKYKHRSSL